MEKNLVLLQNNDNQSENAHKPLQLKLALTTPSKNEIDVTRCQTVYEDGHYSLQLQLKLSEIEEALKDELKNNQRQKMLKSSMPAQASGADMARQNLTVENELVADDAKTSSNNEYDRESESLYINKFQYQQRQQTQYSYNHPKVIYIHSKLNNANTNANKGWRTQEEDKNNYSWGNNSYQQNNQSSDDDDSDDDSYNNDELFKLDDGEEDSGGSDLRLFDDQYKRLTSIVIELNNQRIGQCTIENIGSGDYSAWATFEHRNGMASNQPFLLQYDVLVLAFKLSFEDGYKLTLYAPPLLCASLNSSEAVNINQILFELTNLENNRLLDLMFKSGMQTSKEVTKDDWMTFEENRSYQSLSDYIYLIDQIINCYTNNFSYFKTQAKHSLTKWQKIVPFNQVKQVSSKNFNWLTQNLEELKQVEASMGLIQYQDKSYQPLHMQTESMRKSYSTYENKVVIGFLHLVLHNANKIANEYQLFINQQREQLNKGTQLSHGSYQAPIITMKLIQLERCDVELNKLHASLDKLSNLYFNYQSIFKLPPSFLKTFPRKSKIFQELKPYAEVFMSIWHFFQFGSFHLDKDRMLFEVTTLDRLFEYYCLYRLLEMLVQQGFKPVPNGNRNFEYSILSSINLEHADNDAVANTYILRRGEQQVVLYYQPVIYSKCFENGIRAFRTTQARYPKFFQYGDFYTPDFIMKFRNSNAERYQEEYIIFDAKFAQTNSILQYYISDLTRKYGFETAIAMIEPHQKSLREDKLAHSSQLSQSDADQLPSYQDTTTLSLDKPGNLISRESKREYDFVGSKPPKMIFALQGRISLADDNKQQTFNSSRNQNGEQGAEGSDQNQAKKRYTGVRMHSVRNMLLMQNSDLARLCTPPTTIGLVEFNTQVNSTPALWNEIVRNIPYLANDPRTEQEKYDDATLQAQGAPTKSFKDLLEEYEAEHPDPNSNGL